jgi:hypothetical protein
VFFKPNNCSLCRPQNNIQANNRRRTGSNVQQQAHQAALGQLGELALIILVLHLFDINLATALRNLCNPYSIAIFARKYAMLDYTVLHLPIFRSSGIRLSYV